ncbi:early activation antigen CD69-like [Hyaena hyaena]|uniref:early activation antigen CD69-like n=1 Tax=Hyaena hyaena TaxID=95912 RepID=UPI001920AA31|nr:early activation antigen CD69-like [Hyaena hyaena]
MEGRGFEHNVGTDGREVMEQVTMPGIVTKKMLVMSSMICGGIAFLLWAMLRFPRKFKKPKLWNYHTCSEGEAVCPQDWNHIRNNCFFQSEHEKTWMDSQEACIVYHGSLAIFNSRNQVETLMPLLGTSSYWIGLKKLNARTPWRWINGDTFSYWFKIGGSGMCAFMFQKSISGASCNNTMKYICSRGPLCFR